MNALLARGARRQVSRLAAIIRKQVLPTHAQTNAALTYVVTHSSPPAAHSSAVPDGPTDVPPASVMHLTSPLPMEVGACPQERSVTEGICGLSPEDSITPPAAVPRDALNTEQAAVLHLALDGASLFVGGKAGTGKSFLLRHLARALRDRGLIVSVSATTGIAAVNIEGNTFHSTFGVPVVTADAVPRFLHEVDEDGAEHDVHTDNYSARTEAPIHFSTDLLVGIDVILIDEVSLLHAGYFEALERCCRRVPGNNRDKPFGGVQIIVSGDFLQLSPFESPPKWHSLARFARPSHKERYACPGVWREPILTEDTIEVDEENVSAPGETPRGADEPTSQNQKLTSTTIPSQLALRHYKPHKSTTRRLAPLKYNTLPLYESYVFQHCLVSVQLLCPTRHQEDKLFLAELNLLRVGQMPWRVARSAYLNDEEATAVRLFPTRTSVKNYNDRRMLELHGPAVPFKSRLSLTPRKRRGRSALSLDERRNSSPSSDGAATFLSDPFVLTVVRERPGTRRRSLSYTDAHTLVKRLKTEAIQPLACETPLATHVFVLPSPYHDATRFGRIVVRVESHAAAQAEAWRHALEARANHTLLAVTRDQWGGGAGDRQGSVADRQVMSEARHRRTSRATRGAWKLIQVNEMSAPHVLALARPSLQEQFASVRKADSLLNDKELKVGCRVMLLRNLTHTLVNGALGTIVRFATADACSELLPTEPLKVVLSPQLQALRDAALKPLQETSETPKPATQCFHNEERRVLPVVRMDRTGRLVAIPWITVQVPRTLYDGFFRSQVECLPLSPAYAFTVHKTQGITFDQPIVFDGEHMFPCDHMIYVAASRVRRFSQLRLVNVSPRAVTVHKPSLYFCEQLPNVRTAVGKWASWKSTSTASLSTLFVPNWKQMQ